MTRDEMKRSIRDLRGKLKDAKDGIGHAPTDKDAIECWDSAIEAAKEFVGDDQ